MLFKNAVNKNRQRREEDIVGSQEERMVKRLKPSKSEFRMLLGNEKTKLTLSHPRVINFNFLFQSLSRDISYSMENLTIDSLLK